jgi:hypothetical protein
MIDFRCSFIIATPKKPVQPPRHARLGDTDVVAGYCQRAFDGSTLAPGSGNESRFASYWVMYVNLLGA